MLQSSGWLQQPLLLPVLPMAMLSPRISAGVPGVLCLLHHTQQLQQGTPPGWDIWDFPLPSPSPGPGDNKRSTGLVFSRFPRGWSIPAAPRCTHLSRSAEARPGRGRWQQGWAGSSSWALPSGDSPAGDTRWPQSPGLRRAPCPAPPALLLQRVPAAVPAI